MDLRNKAVLITAGPTRERLDPVRFMTNSSSGAMGAALAREGLRRGARVTVVRGPCPADFPQGAVVVPVESALDMRREVMSRRKGAAVIIGAAAVGDWRFAKPSSAKLKRGPGALALKLIPNPDIIKEAASRRRPGQVIVGFALETGAAAAKARAKLRAKGLDLIVANGVESLGAAASRFSIISRDGSEKTLSASKAALARALFDRVEALA